MGAVHFVWDPTEDNIVFAIEASGPARISYVNEPGRGGGTIARLSGSQCEFLHFDGQRSVIAVTDEVQNVVASYAYTAFGEIAESSGSTNELQFRGGRQWFRLDSRFEFLAHGDIYAAGSGRFLSLIDPEGLAATAVAQYNPPGAVAVVTEENGASTSPAGEAGNTEDQSAGFTGLTLPSIDTLWTPCRAAATGPCNIRIYAGHGRVTDDVVPFFTEHNVVNPCITTGCGNYLGVVACFSGGWAKQIPPERRIPGFNDIGGNALPAEMAWGAVQAAIIDAERFASILCQQRKRFCDDGLPERYMCGTNNQRCDSVTIQYYCDADMRTLLTTGVGPSKNKVPGLPGAASKALCDTVKTISCL